jgi:hypothetical protein
MWEKREKNLTCVNALNINCKASGWMTFKHIWLQRKPAKLRPNGIFHRGNISGLFMCVNGWAIKLGRAFIGWKDRAFKARGTSNGGGAFLPFS